MPTWPELVAAHLKDDAPVTVTQCEHEARRAWRCLDCGQDLWPARRAALLREYGVAERKAEYRREQR